MLSRSTSRRERNPEKETTVLLRIDQVCPERLPSTQYIYQISSHLNLQPILLSMQCKTENLFGISSKAPLSLLTVQFSNRTHWLAIHTVEVIGLAGEVAAEEARVRLPAGLAIAESCSGACTPHAQAC